MGAIQLVAFDLAGTTIRDRGEVERAFLVALDKHGIVATADEIQQRRGAAKRDVFRYFVERQLGTSPDNEALAADVLADFRQVLQESYGRDGVAVVPGTEETFAWLRASGIRVAVMTGFDREITDTLLHAVGWRDRLVDAVVCSDDVARGRPAPYLIFRAMEQTGVTDVRRVIVVGDTANDLLAGANAGVLGVVGVLSGSQGIETLGKVWHTHIIGSVAELPALVQTAFA